MPVAPPKLQVPVKLEECLEILNQPGTKQIIQTKTERGRFLRSVLQRVEEAGSAHLQEAKLKHPLAFAKLGWEQALKANAWVWGITFLLDFDANRKGKTSGAIFNALLWMFPNDPKWLLFQPYEDDWQREVRVLPRPPIQKVRKLQRILELNPHLKGDPKFQPYDEESGNKEKFALLQSNWPDCFAPAFPNPPSDKPKSVIWQGAPDAAYNKDLIMPEWKKWLPQNSIRRWSEYDKKITLDIQGREWNIIFKSYESKDEKFSGGAVDGILLTEGVLQAHLNEIKQRFKEDAWSSWDYTPYEPRNTGQKTSLAFKVFRGKEQLPLRPYVFTGFGIEKTPDFILPESKRNDLMRAWAGKPEGEARIKGNFFTSSPVVLSNLDTDFHTVPWSKEELFQRHPNGRLYRGFDPGFDHPTACAWGLLTQTNCWFIYRMLSTRELSVGQRCRKVIELSNNKQQRVKYGPGQDDYYFEEVNTQPDSELITLTIADYHLFKTDEITKRPYSTNYLKEGLTVVPSITYAPKQRGQLFDRALEPDLVRAHPITRKPPGARVFFLINETGVAEAVEKLENIFWKRYTTGELKGEPKDEMQELEDDEFDAISYLVCSPYRWSSETPERKTISETRSEETIALLQTDHHR